MWPDLIRKAKEGGLNTIETYVFWNGHEPRRRQANNLSLPMILYIIPAPTKEFLRVELNPALFSLFCAVQLRGELRHRQVLQGDPACRDVRHSSHWSLLLWGMELWVLPTLSSLIFICILMISFCSDCVYLLLRARRGLSAWLRNIPGMQFRLHNDPFEVN